MVTACDLCEPKFLNVRNNILTATIILSVLLDEILHMCIPCLDMEIFTGFHLQFNLFMI